MDDSLKEMDPTPRQRFALDKLDKIMRGEIKTTTRKGSLLKRPYRVWASRKHGEFGNVDEGNANSLSARRVAFSVASSIVGLSSCVGDENLFVCSGIVVEKNDMVATILTSATLLIGDEDTMPSNVMVEVHLPNRETVSGVVSHIDFHHNIATLTVPSDPVLRVAILSPDSDLYFPGMDVVAVGRRASNLLASYGEVKLKYHDFDSEDVLSTSSTITNNYIGGPLVDSCSGYVVGLNFCDSDCTVFLPSTILLRCLKHFKNYGRVVRPWLGMRTRNLDTLKLAQLETIYQKFPDISGVFVDKVIEGSPAESAVVCQGDIVTHCDGIRVSSPLEFVGILFDKAENCMELNPDRASDSALKRRAISVEVVIRRESSHGQVETKSIIVDRFSPPENNRWPLRRRSKLNGIW